MRFAGTPPWRAGVALTVAVLGVHALLLQALTSPGPAPAPSATRAFTLRTIDAPPTPVQPTLPPPKLAAAPDLPAAPRERQTTSSAIPATRPAKGAPSPSPSIDPASTAGVTPGRAAAPSAPMPAPPSTHADVAVPTSRQLRYHVTASSRGVALRGESTLTWQHDGDRYEARLEMRMPTLPTRVQHSSGRVGPGGLEPIRFSEKTRGEQASHFDRATGQVIFSANRPAAVLETGAQDRLSVLLQLAARVAAAPGLYPAGSTIALQTVGTRDADTWVFHVEGPDTLQLPSGPMPALKLLRPPRHTHDTTVEVWLAPGMDYVPVRTRLTQAHGDWLEQQWSATDR